MAETGNKGLVYRKPISNAVKIELKEKLEYLSKKSKIKQSELLDEALLLLFAKYKKYFKDYEK
ncbi:MAG TPA: ribbon-helix-helix domain-containing protein [Patescibacteria group bacterium]|nr:ribbon-helix-helix domain-containing protein [Patescibacteria group bacterium]